jgi:hypothetical protein
MWDQLPVARMPHDAHAMNAMKANVATRATDTRTLYMHLVPRIGKMGKLGLHQPSTEHMDSLPSKTHSICPGYHPAIQSAIAARLDAASLRQLRLTSCSCCDATSSRITGLQLQGSTRHLQPLKRGTGQRLMSVRSIRIAISAVKASLLTLSHFLRAWLRCCRN